MSSITTTSNTTLVKAPVNETKIPLRRVLGLTTAILLVISNMIGTGVFKKIVPMAATGLNESFVLGAWIVAGIITLFGAFTFAGLAKMTTQSGGFYEYLRLCFGDFISFSFGWGYFVIIGSGSIAAVGFVFAQSVNSLISLPDILHQWENISVGNFIYPFAGSGVKIFATIVIISLTCLNYLGIKKGTFVNNVLTIAKISGILLLIVLGTFFSHQPVHHSVPAVKNQFSGIGTFGMFFSAMLSAFWAYDGFTNIGCIASEIKNPKRNIALAIITAVCIVMALYVLVNYAYMKAIPANQLASLGENTIAATAVAENIIGKPGNFLISILITISSFATLNVMIIFYSRIYFRMAQENMFFRNAAKVHPRYQTPYLALLYSPAWSIILILSGTFDMLTDMVVFSSFLFYILAAIGLIKMKRKGTLKEKIPGYPALHVLFILFTLVLLINTLIIQPKQTITGFALILSCVPFYYFFKRSKKKVTSLLQERIEQPSVVLQNN